MGTSLIRSSTPVGSYRKTMPRVGPMVSLGGDAVSYERGTPVVTGASRKTCT